jgi:hypothetical protein
LKHYTYLILIGLLLFSGALVTDAWLGARGAAATLAVTLATQKNIIEQADIRERDRSEQLASALAKIAAQKRRVQTPVQIATALPALLPRLPVPISLQLPPLVLDPSHETARPPIAIPVEDLKPLYDGIQDCRACALERDAYKDQLTSERARATALTRERDAAVTAARGGNWWARMKHGAKWFAIGVVVATSAAAASRRGF